MCMRVFTNLPFTHDRLFYSFFLLFVPSVTLSRDPPITRRSRQNSSYSSNFYIYIYNNNMMLTKLSVYAHISYTYALD